MNDEWREFLFANCDLFKNITELYNALKDEFSDCDVCYSTVTRVIRSRSWRVVKEEAHSKRGRPRDSNISRAIQSVLEQECCLSSRQIAVRTGYAHSTVRWTLKNVLGLKYTKTRWIPHILTVPQRDARALLSAQLLDVLDEAKRTNFHFLITGDESWFFYASPHKGLWLPEGAEPLEAQRPSHYSKKTMVTIFWGVNGPVAVEILPTGQKWTAEYFIGTVVPQIVESDAYQRSRAQKQRFVLHMDNAPIHTADTVKTCLAMYNIVLAPHPPYSPDLAPSDFYLFGKLKELARGCEFETVEDIKNWILSQFEEISMDELRRVYISWEDRLVRCISLNGSYIYCSFISYV